MLSPREMLLARVLGGMAPDTATVVVLSASHEPAAEAVARHDAASAFAPYRVIFAYGANTYDEAWRMVTRPHLGTEVAILTSAYHQLRAFLTWLAVLQFCGKERQTRLYNAPAPSGMEKLEIEFDKIAEYQQRGHVASFEQGLAYLDWLCATS